MLKEEREIVAMLVFATIFCLSSIFVSLFEIYWLSLSLVWLFVASRATKSSFCVLQDR